MTKQALMDMELETGARGEAKLEAETERDDLKTQVENDSKYLEETQTAFDTKSEEWDVRKEARAEEIAAIQEAISILHSDDARDTFKSSFKSQGHLLLQEGSCRKHHRTPERRRPPCILVPNAPRLFPRVIILAAFSHSLIFIFGSYFIF